MTYNFRYNSLKNVELIASRWVGFEDIIEAIGMNDGLIDIIEHPSSEYSHQIILIVLWNDYIYSIPCVPEGENTFFMKTIIPSRKYKKLYS